MDKKEFKSELPSAAGSPFKTKNFNKFFFGIILATLLIIGLVILYLTVLVHRS